MLRVPIVASLLISAAVVAVFAVLLAAAGLDVLSPGCAVLGILIATITCSVLRQQVMALTERCTMGGIVGSAFIVLAFHNVGGWLGFQGIPELLIGVVLFGTGVFEILSPHLFQERWERKKEEWDQAAR